MKVENDDTFIDEKMTSKDSTFNQIEELRVVFLIVYDFIELFIIIERTLNKCERLLCRIIKVNDALHKLIAFSIKDE